MKPDRSADYLGHMIEAAGAAMSYVQGMDQNGFMQDRRTQQAVLHNIMVIGEAATQLAQTAPALVASCPEVPWQSLRGMRNRVAHGYFDIDLNVVWNTVQGALPALMLSLTALRSRLPVG